MAAGSFTVYTAAVTEIGNGSFDFSSDTYVMILVTNSYTPSPNTDTHYSDVSSNEVASGSGYTTGGVVLSGVSWSASSATNTFTFTAPTWASFSATFRYAVIVRRSGGSLVSTDLLLAYVDGTGGGSLTGGGGTLTITPNAGGVFTGTHSP
jgi:hypothetical protein